jgi:hypothetical protein
MNVDAVLPRDAIPSVDDPSFGRDYVGDPDDEVVVVDGAAVGGTAGVDSGDGGSEEAPPPAPAYPIRILSYHEIVNDAVGGRPIAVTWCPICWSAAVYDRTVGGRTLTFGTSGKLADDALVMYDRATGTEWRQTTGRAISGELEGERLRTLAAPVTTWKRFAAEHPDGVVLQPVRGGESGSGRSARDAYDMRPYERYARSGEFGLYGMRGEGRRRTWDREDVDAKAVVLGIERGDEAAGYPVDHVEAARSVVTDTVGGLDVVVFAADGRTGAFEDPGFAFETRGGTVRGDGATWDPTTGRSSDGRRLDRVPARRLFAFAWQDAHGPDSFVGT